MEGNEKILHLVPLGPKHHIIKQHIPVLLSRWFAGKDESHQLFFNWKTCLVKRSPFIFPHSHKAVPPRFDVLFSAFRRLPHSFCIQFFPHLPNFSRCWHEECVLSTRWCNERKSCTHLNKQTFFQFLWCRSSLFYTRVRSAEKKIWPCFRRFLYLVVF